MKKFAINKGKADEKSLVIEGWLWKMIHRGLLNKVSAWCGFFEKSRDSGADAAIHATLSYYALAIPIEYHNDIGVNVNHILSTEKSYKA